MVLNIDLKTVDQVRDITLRAGREIMKIYNSDFQVDEKSDSSPVTEADRLAEDLITKAIREEISDDFPIVAEEAVAAGNIPDVAGTPFWLVDPLDGTKQFVSKRGEFTVNIALIDAGRPVLGVVHAPAIDATYWGSRNGSFAETGPAGAQPIHCRPYPDKGLVVLVSRSHRTPEVDEYLATLDVKKEISSGSSIKFCLVAASQADLYPRFGRTMEWDTAAGHAVLMFAGGEVVNLDETPFTYGKPGFENPNFIARGRTKPLVET